MKLITATDIISWDPCDDYSHDEIKRRVKRGVTVQQIIDSKLSLDAKTWLLLHEHEALFTARALHELACMFAEDALNMLESKGRRIDPRRRAAIQAKRDWLAGKITTDELAAARAAARAVTLSVARVAGWDDGWDDVWSIVAGFPAGFAARDAARVVAWAAAQDAAAIDWDNAWVAARKKQLWQISEKLKERR